MSRRHNDSRGDEGLEAKLRLLPAAPGVYLHKDARGKVIYVGKAKRLSQRVRSYFQAGGDHDAKTASLVRKIVDFDYVATESEAEALVLENQLIKEYRPYFNVRLKDDKQYPYLKISVQEAYPRVTVVRRIADDGARYFGPYTDVRAMRETLRFATGLFQVRTCSLDLPDPTVERPCLDHQIGRCSAPCTGLDDRDGYRRKVRRLIGFLEGRDRKVVTELQDEMKELATALRYEDAAHVRDRIARLERTVSRSVVIGGFTGDADLCGLARDGAEACGVVLRVRQGRVLTSHHFQLADRLDRDTEVFVAQLLREYYTRAGDIPGEVLLSHEVPDREDWEQWLGYLRGSRVRVRRPQRGAKRKAIDMAAANAAFKLGERVLQEGHEGRSVTPAAVLLQEALGLHSVPETIECFDISTFQGRETVGSLVYFRGGEPHKARYRRFRIRTVGGVDDFASMGEVLDRYYGRLEEKEEQPADLVVVDGGAGQLSVARRVLVRHGFGNTQLIGLAKREETIHREGEEIRLSRNSGALKLLQRVRDEAHRFAITYHRLLRDKRTQKSVLDLIPGIGQVKKLSLLHHFGSVRPIASASAEELTAVRGIGPYDAASIITYFEQHPELAGPPVAPADGEGAGGAGGDDA